MTPNPTDAVGPAAAEYVFAALGDNERRVENRRFDGASVTGLFGNCSLDVRKATAAPGEHVVEVFGLFADIRIIVPPGWNVVLHVTSILADVEDRRGAPITPMPEGTAPPCLMVRGTLLFADLTIDD